MADVGGRCDNGLPLRRPPLLGEHTEQVLHEVVKLPAAEIERLTAAEAVGR